MYFHYAHMKECRGVAEQLFVISGRQVKMQDFGSCLEYEDGEANIYVKACDTSLKNQRWHYKNLALMTDDEFLCLTYKTKSKNGQVELEECTNDLTGQQWHGKP